MAPPSKRNYMEIMEIDDGSGSAMMEEKKEPKRVSRSELERREYWLRWRAADASNKLVAVRHRQENLKWKNMSKRRLIKEELFFSKDIDFTRIKLSDAPAPARWDLVFGKAQITKPAPAPAGGVTSPVMRLQDVLRSSQKTRFTHQVLKLTRFLRYFVWNNSLVRVPKRLRDAVRI